MSQSTGCVSCQLKKAKHAVNTHHITGDTRCEEWCPGCVGPKLAEYFPCACADLAAQEEAMVSRVLLEMGKRLNEPQPLGFYGEDF